MELHIKTDRSSKTSSIPPKDEFPCIPVLLSILINEYEQEKLRSDRIDNKAISLLTIILALITVYVPIFPFENITKIYSKSDLCAIMPFIFSLCLVAGLVAAILAVYSSYKVIEAYKIKAYKAVDIQAFNTDKKLGQPTADGFQVELIDHYQSIILENSKVNSNKVATINVQFRNVVIIFILLSVSAIGALIIVGFV